LALVLVAAISNCLVFFGPTVHISDESCHVARIVLDLDTTSHLILRSEISVKKFGLSVW
jgi:hypothetical protein